MRVTVRLFARLRDAVGSAELVCEAPETATIRDVWAQLVSAHPELAAYTSSLSCAHNEEYARWDARLRDGDEVAFLPPVSGGCPPGFCDV